MCEFVCTVHAVYIRICVCVCLLVRLRQCVWVGNGRVRVVMMLQNVHCDKKLMVCTVGCRLYSWVSARNIFVPAFHDRVLQCNTCTTILQVALVTIIKRLECHDPFLILISGQQTSFCTNGFTSSLSSEQEARNGRQYIFPFINFTCHGNVTLWRFYARFNGNQESTLYPEFQIWRLTDSLYTKVSHTNISSDNELAGIFTGGIQLYTHNISVSGPMTFQPGDIVGVHTPVCCGGNNPRSRLRLRFNQQSNGPLGYFLNQGIDTQPSSTFQLSDSSVSTSSQDIPALSAQIVMFETTSELA